MTDAMTGPKPPQGPREQAEALMNRNEGILRAAVGVISPDNPEASPLEVFSSPREVRATGVALELTAEQEDRFRSIAGELGFGRETDKTSEQAGLPDGYVAVIEGGQSHKVEAQCRLVESASTLIFAGSPHRKITAEAERASGARVLGIDPESVGVTEYDVVRQIAEAQPDFVPNETGDEVLPFGYDIWRNHQVTEDPTGQFIKIGTVNDRDVVLLRIDRENYQDDAGKSRYCFQPNSAAVMGIVSDVLAKRGDDDTPVGFLTSATYQPSRDIAAVSAGIRYDRQFGVVSYGTSTLAEVKGEVAKPGPINQLPGELHTTATQTAKLRKELGL